MAEDKPSQEVKPPPSRAVIVRGVKTALLKDKKFLWSIFWRIGFVVWGIAAALNTFWGWSAREYLRSAEDRIKQQIDKTETNLSDNVVASGVQISNLVLRTFESSNITALVRSVAAERASNMLETQVAPAVAKFTNEIAVFSQRIEGQQGKIDELNSSLLKAHETESNLVALIADANKALKNLDENTEFITTVVLADHDDRTAFEQLEKWSADPNFPLRVNAKNVFQRIQADLFKTEKTWATVNWDAIVTGTERAQWDIHHINAVWEEVMTSATAMDFVIFVGGHTNITKEQKLSFLRNVYSDDSRNSLQAAHKAAEIVAGELKAKYNPPLRFGPVEMSWQQFKTTNHLFALSANSTTNVVHEIFLPSDTNRLQIFRDWPTMKGVLLRTEFVPKINTLEGKYIDYGVSRTNTINFGGAKYKNMAWSFFGTESNKFDFKFELKYEKDTASEVVKDMQLTTNSMIFDKVHSVSIPQP